MLKFEDPQWRFRSPAEIPSDAIGEFLGLISRIATQAENAQEVYEEFKSQFAPATSRQHVWSSSESWAFSDLSEMMFAAAENTPVFIEAFFDACQSIQKDYEDWAAPGPEEINTLCQRFNVGYVIDPPNLRRSGEGEPLVEVQAEETLLERARNEFRQQIERSAELLEQGKGREAVQNVLWVLESVSTAFIDVDVEGTKIKGHYFNKIISELRRASSGTVLNRALEWLDALHGYLSSPTGGGVRHGMNLGSDPISVNEARLFCNLIRSYIDYLLREYERIMNE